MNIRKSFLVKYNGNASRFKSFNDEVLAHSKREAVEIIYALYNDENYFPQDDGSILDCNGNLLAEPESETIEYDGGCCYAEELLD